jgi:hypothetical protein
MMSCREQREAIFGTLPSRSCLALNKYRDIVERSEYAGTFGQLREALVSNE